MVREIEYGITFKVDGEEEDITELKKAMTPHFNEFVMKARAISNEWELNNSLRPSVKDSSELNGGESDNE